MLFPSDTGWRKQTDNSKAQLAGRCRVLWVVWVRGVSACPAADTGWFQGLVLALRLWA